MNPADSSTESEPDTKGPTTDGLSWFVRGLILLGLLIMTVVLYRQSVPTRSTDPTPTVIGGDTVADVGRFEKSNRTLKTRSDAWKNRSDRVRRLLRRLGVVPVQPEPGFADGRLVDLDGESHRLKELRNSWLLVNFWATWCPPCREEMPSLQRLKRRFSQPSFQLLTIDLGEKPKRVRSFLENQDLNLPVWIDSTGNVSDSFAVTGLPVSWILTPDGEVLGRIRGPRQWDEDPASTLFANLIREQTG